MEDCPSQFADFLSEVEQTEFDTNTTATGTLTIQQSQRNLLRKKGIAAFKADLEWLYGDLFDVVETKDGIVIVAENEPGDFTFSWEVKTTIKAIDYDPFIEASAFEESEIQKASKKAQREKDKEDKIKATEAKRAKKLAELEARQNNN